MNPDDVQHLARAVAILEELTSNDSGHPEYQFLLALCYREQTNQAPERKNQQSIDVLVKLCEQYPHVPEYRYELGASLAEVPVHEFRDADIFDSIDSLRLSLQQLNLLTQSHPNIPRYIESAAHTHHKLGTLLRRVARESSSDRKANMDEAQRHLRMAVRLQKSQCVQFPDSVSEQIWLARMRDNLASCLRGENSKEALELIENSIAESLHLVSGSGDKVPATHILIGQYETKAEILDELNRAEAADAARREANDLRERLPPPHLRRGPP